MADLSRHQEKIVKRYYQHLDARTIHTLGEIVSDLYLAEGKAADRLWKRAETALKKTDVPPDRLDRIITARDLKQLADVVGKLASTGT